MEIVKYNYNSYCNKYRLFRKNDEKNYNFIYCSSHVFLLPSIYGLYKQNFCIWFFSSCILITSLLRWKYIHNNLYQFIDHNFVKVVFCLGLYTIFLDLMKNIHHTFINYILICLFVNIIFYYSLGVIFDLFCNKFDVIFHIIMHLNACFLLLLFSYLSYDMSITIHNIYDFFNYYLTKFQFLSS